MVKEEGYNHITPLLMKRDLEENLLQSGGSAADAAETEQN